MKLWISGTGVALLLVAAFLAWHDKDWVVWFVGGIVLTEIWWGIGIVVKKIQNLKGEKA